MRIGEAAKLSGLSIDTIRYYEKSDMLPRIARSADGNRQFSAEAVDWLLLLKSLRETGMPLETMRHFAGLYRDGNETIAERRKILVAHGIRLRDQRAELDRCEALLAYKLKMYDGVTDA